MNFVYTLSLALFVCLSGCSTPEIPVELRFCESTYWNDGELYISNFGSSELSPLNNEGKGYIAKMDIDGNITTLIAPDGTLNAPKGMAVLKNKLYIADVNKVVCYNLENLSEAPKVLILPEGELFANDLVTYNNLLLVSVTNTGNIFSICIEDMCSARKVANVPGANGMAVSENGKVYVASYAPDEVVTEKNVIYLIEDMTNPIPKPIISETDQYDGLALSECENRLYFTSWRGRKLGVVDLTTGDISTVKNDCNFIGAADLTLNDTTLYIPDLVQSKVFTIQVSRCGE